MSHSSQLIDSAERKCRESGARLTNRRRLVLKTLIEAGGSMSAYELLDRCNESLTKRMPAMSIYRILDFLESNSFVHKLTSQNKYIACEHIECCDQHFFRSQFLICSDCPTVREIKLGPATYESMQQTAASAGFSLEGVQLEVIGACASCASIEGDL